MAFQYKSGQLLTLLIFSRNLCESSIVMHQCTYSQHKMNDIANLPTFLSSIFSLVHAGVTVSIETAYSPVMKRQYLNVNFIPTAAFTKTTEGLCGFMDDDETNDLVGPNGQQFNDLVGQNGQHFNDPLQFAESCEFTNVLSSLSYYIFGAISYHLPFSHDFRFLECIFKF